MTGTINILGSCLVYFGILLGTAVVRSEGVPSELPVGDIWHVKDDEYSICNIGSACREEFRVANGSSEAIWPELDDRTRTNRLNGEKNRLRINKYQPPLVPKYTEVGYKKEKLPADTFDYLMNWYTKAKHSKTEKWSPDNTYVNHWKHDTVMVNAPKDVEKRLFDDLQPLMEDWAGITLRSTACYGVRIYPRGSVLANHVDRVDTHVISAIINVAQHNVDKDWKLFVRGHDGVERNIAIQPGEIVYYESASVIHGRPEAFEGESFANIFVHFAPVEGWAVRSKDIQDHAWADIRRKEKAEKDAQRAEQKEQEL